MIHLFAVVKIFVLASTTYQYFRFVRKERNAFQRLIERVTRAKVCNKTELDGLSTGHLDEQRIGIRHFSVGGYPGKGTT